MASKQKNRTELISKCINMHNYTTPKPIKFNLVFFFFFLLLILNKQERGCGGGGGGGGTERKWKKRAENSINLFFPLLSGMIKECMATKFITTSPGTKLWKFTFTGTTANLPAVYLMDNRENLPVSCFNLPYSSMIKAATADQGSHLWPRQPPHHSISFLTGSKMRLESDSYIYPQLTSNKLCYTDNCL